MVVIILEKTHSFVMLVVSLANENSVVALHFILNRGPPYTGFVPLEATLRIAHLFNILVSYHTLIVFIEV